MKRFRDATPLREGDGTGSPYLDAQNVWLERYGNYVAQAANWRLVALLEAVVLLVAVVGLIFTANQSKLVPYVVAVDTIGNAIAVKPADRATPVDPLVLRAQLAHWIRAARSVVQDPIAENQNLHEVFDLVPNSDSPAMGFLREYYQNSENNPLHRAQTVSVEVQVNQVTLASVNRSDNRTYAIYWTEVQRDRQGHKTRSQFMEANLDLQIVPPSDEATILKNPLGIQISALNWLAVPTMAPHS